MKASHICVCVCVCVLRLMVIISNQAEFKFWMRVFTNVLGWDMNPSLLNPVMGKLVGQTGFLALVGQLV